MLPRLYVAPPFSSQLCSLSGAPVDQAPAQTAAGSGSAGARASRRRLQRPHPRRARRATTRCRSSASRSTAPTIDHFDWVNPDAPKGGTLRGFVEGSFDNLNPFTMQGVPAQSIGLIYDSLLASSPDEPSTEYGLIAEWVSYPPDYSSVTFGLRPEARFHDGTADHARGRHLQSSSAQKKAHPAIRVLLQERRQGGEDRRPRGHLHLRRRKATASCRRSSDS